MGRLAPPSEALTRNRAGDSVYTRLHICLEVVVVTASVGVREFRRSLSDFIDQPEPVTITRHGQTVGLFIPIRRGREADIAAYAEAAKKASALLAEWGASEDDVVAEFDELRRSESDSSRV